MFVIFSLVYNHVNKLVAVIFSCRRQWLVNTLYIWLGSYTIIHLTVEIDPVGRWCYTQLIKSYRNALSYYSLWLVSLWVSIVWLVNFLWLVNFWQCSYVDLLVNIYTHTHTHTHMIKQFNQVLLMFLIIGYGSFPYEFYYEVTK